MWSRFFRVFGVVKVAVSGCNRVFRFSLVWMQAWIYGYPFREVQGKVGV
jgi:hypothetical protein